MLNFKSARNAIGMKQEEVAAILNISRASYTNLENGKRDPDTTTLIQLSKLYHVSTDYLLGIVDQEPHAMAGQISPDEKKLLEAFQQLNEAGQKLLMQHAIDYLNTQSLRKDASISSMG